MTGMHLGSYEILAPLGKGGMGEVFRARDTRLDREVAIKVLPAEFSQDNERLRRFEQEARATSALNHPNILTVYDFGTHNGNPYLVMELLEGEELRAQLDNGALPVRKAIDYAAQIAAGLAAAHEKGIVHRDLKPENLFVTKDGRVKILDFGLAKLRPPRNAPVGSDVATQKQLTNPGTVMGTVAYMSPEQARGQDTDHRSDIFSAGLILYEMLAGQRAFQRETMAETMTAIMKEDPPEFQNEKISPALEKVVRHCLEKRPELRFQSVRDLGFALEALSTPSGARVETAALPAVTGPITKALWFGNARLPWIVAAVATLLLLAALPFAVATVRWFASRVSNVAPLMTTAPFTTLPGSESEPTFSPDGNQIAFVWNGERGDNQDIYVKQIGNETLVRLTTNPAQDRAPSWSPNGRWIAFTRRASDEIGLYLIPSLGGAERKIAALAPTLLPEFPVPLSWTPDSEGLAVLDKSSPQEPYGIWLVARETGEKRRLTTPQTKDGDGRPTVSPDGKTILFTRLRNPEMNDLYLVPITGGEPQQVLFDQETSVSSPTWTPDGRAILFIARRDGADSLWKVPETGGTPVKVEAVRDNLSGFVLSRQGNRLAWAQSLDDTNIWRLELDATGKPKTAPQQLLASTRMEVDARFSPDGSKIAFASNRSGSIEIWVAESDGQRPVQLTSFNGPLTGSPRWSPDGRQIAFDSRAAGNNDIYIISAEGGKPRRLTTEASNEALPSWSRDGAWIYFCSDCNNSNQQIWKMPASGGQAVQVTKNGGFDNVESPDGQYLYFTKGYRVPGIWRLPVVGGEETFVLNHHRAGQWRYWAVKEQGIYFATAETPERPLLEFFSFATGKVTPLATLEKKISYFGFAGLDVSPDGRFLIWQQLDQEGSDIMVMENFH